jgi:hypothetical protein
MQLTLAVGSCTSAVTSILIYGAKINAEFLKMRHILETAEMITLRKLVRKTRLDRLRSQDVEE